MDCPLLRHDHLAGEQQQHRAVAGDEQRGPVGSPNRPSSSPSLTPPPTSCAVCGSTTTNTLPHPSQPSHTIITAPDERSIIDLALSHDGNLIASALMDATMMLNCVHCGLQHHKFRGHASAVKTAAFSPGDEYLASGGIDDKILIRCTTTFDVLHIISSIGRIAEVTCLKFAPTHGDDDGGPLLASTSLCGTVMLHRIHDDGQPPTRLHAVAFNRVTDTLSFSPDDESLLVGTKVAFAFLDVSTRKLRKTHSIKETTRVAYSPTGELIAVGGNAGKAMLLDANTCNLVTDLSGSEHMVRAIAFSPDGRTVAIGSHFTVYLHDVQSGEVFFTYTNGRFVNAIVFSSDGQRVFSGCAGGIVQMHWVPKQSSGSKCTSLPTTTADLLLYRQFRATLPRDITDEEAMAAFRAAECGGKYAFPTWQNAQQRTMASAVNEVQEDGGLFALFASLGQQYTLPSSTIKALYVIWRMKHRDWTVDGKKKEALVKNIKAFCEKRLGAPRSIAVNSTIPVDADSFASFIVSPNNLQFKGDAARDAMHQAWVGFCDQTPSTESLDAKVEGFMRRVRKDEDGNASFDAAVLPIYWPRYSNGNERALAEAMCESSPLESANERRRNACVLKTSIDGNPLDVEEYVVKNLYNWFQRKLGGKGLPKATINKTYLSWKMYLAEKKMEDVKNARKLAETLDVFLRVVGLL